MRQTLYPISDALADAIKLAPVPGYRLARVIGIHAATLSAWRTKKYRVSLDDPRVLQLATLLGVPADEAFDREVRTP